MVHEHKKLKLQIELKDFSQAQYETYHTRLLEYTRGNQSTAVASGGVVRAAIDAGFLLGVVKEEVPEMKPKAVSWITRKIHEHVLEITEIPDDDPN